MKKRTDKALDRAKTVNPIPPKPQRSVDEQRYPLPSNVEMYALRKSLKGWTAKRLASYGIPWPLPSGWRDRLIELTIKGHTKWAGWLEEGGARGKQSPSMLAKKGKRRHRKADGSRAMSSAEAISHDKCTRCGKPAPFVLTDGAKPDGTLRVIYLCGNACASQLGYHWAAKPVRMDHHRGMGT